MDFSFNSSQFPKIDFGQKYTELANKSKVLNLLSFRNPKNRKICIFSQFDFADGADLLCLRKTLAKGFLREGNQLFALYKLIARRKKSENLLFLKKKTLSAFSLEKMFYFIDGKLKNKKHVYFKFLHSVYHINSQ